MSIRRREEKTKTITVGRRQKIGGVSDGGYEMKQGGTSVVHISTTRGKEHEERSCSPEKKTITGPTEV